MKFLQFSAAIFAVFLASCGEPEADATAAAPALDPASEAEVAPKPKEQAPPPPLENAEPFVSIKIAGETIEIVGSIKSALQKKKIVQHLGEAFPELEIADDLEVDYRRIAVGWGNRFADGYVVPFLKQVPGGTFAYKDGVVKLTGEVSDQRALRNLVTVAGDMFAGDFTQDIDSTELIVKEK